MIPERGNIRWYEMFILNILKRGQIPNHIAYIMDGNRRYAREKNAPVSKGHADGYQRMTDVLNWCIELGVKEITVYAFSIENFKRSKEEVDNLMDLFRSKLQEMVDRKDELIADGLRFRFFGKLELLAPRIKKLISEVTLLTKDCNRNTMNVCMAYTAREEMTTAMNDIAIGIERKQLHESDIDEQLISKCLYTSHSYDLDLIVRTSGESRLSDFMLWQSSFSMLSFTDTLWPDFNIWAFFAGIMFWQIKRNKNQSFKTENSSNTDSSEKDVRIDKFLSDLYKKRMEKIIAFKNECF